MVTCTERLLSWPIIECLLAFWQKRLIQPFKEQRLALIVSGVKTCDDRY